MSRFLRRLAAVALLFAAVTLAPGCGGAASPEVPADPTVAIPDVALVLVSGHAPIAAGADYMDATVGAYLATELAGAGYDVETFGFVDAGTGARGFGDLKSRLAEIRDAWILGRPEPARVVLVAHSHGGPWAHAATRDVPDCPIRCLVDLDTNSYGWSLTHGGDAALLGGSPDDPYVIPVSVNPPAYPTVLSEPGFAYDLEDVVFPSVQEALEVVTGDLVVDLTPPYGFVRYDSRWNARLDGTTTGLTAFHSGTAHAEPVTPPAQGGTTLVVVRDWILGRLGAP